MNNRPTLPALGRISIRVLNLSTEVESALKAACMVTVGHLFHPTATQRVQLREHLDPAGARELIGKARAFYRNYRKVQRLLTGVKSGQTNIATEQKLKEERVAYDTSIYQRIPLNVLGLSADAYNALRRVGVTQIEQLRALLEEESGRLREIRLSLQPEIKTKLEAFLEQPVALQEFLARPPAESEEGTDADSALEALNLSRSIIRTLKQAGIETISELNHWSDEELAGIVHIGPWRVRGIRSAVTEYVEQHTARPAEVEDDQEQTVALERTPDKSLAKPVANAKEQRPPEVGPETDGEWADTPVAEFDVTKQVCAKLEEAGVETAHDLAEMTDAELGQISYVGDAVIARIRHQLRELREEYGREQELPEPEEKSPLLYSERSIAVLDLSTSAYRRLYRAGIHRLDALLALSHAELLSIHNIGPALAEEIETKLETYLQQPVDEARTQVVDTTKFSQPESLHASKAHLAAPLAALKLDSRAYNALRRAGVETIEELLLLPEADLMAFEGVGDVILEELRQKVRTFVTEPTASREPEAFWPRLPGAELPEVMDQWFTMFLTSRQREIVEHRYGLYGEAQTLKALGSQFGVTRERIRQIQQAALEQLQTDLRPITSLLELARRELVRTKGILALERWEELLDEQSISLGDVQPLGLLELLADLEERWIVYAIGDGVLFEGVSTRGEAEEKLADRQRSHPKSSTPAPVKPSREGARGDTGLTTDIAFAPDHNAVLHNVRQWNRDLETRASKEAWGQRTVTYFVYDRQSNSFAPSKFCAYVPSESGQGRAPWLTVALYARIDRENPIFDGQRARLHLTDTLGFGTATPKQDTHLRQSFDTWAQAHTGSVTVHPRGPKLLLPEAVLISLREELEQEELVIKQPPVEPTQVLPEGKPRPQTRKVTAADLAPTVAPSTAAEERLAEDSPFYEVEMELREQFGKVDFIGELAIEEEQFQAWCKLVQTHVIGDGKFRPRQIPPAAFVTQMVFAARYSEEEARNFWQPYAQMVWGLEEASAYFQLRCRNRSKEAIAFLSDQYGLFFPQRSAGDLVRPIYRHAIIPAYLEREFVDWLKRHWRKILETPEGFLIPQLRQERSLDYLSRILRNFIQGADTAETAAALIRNMATAASLHAEGESLADIHDLLAGSPIEQSLWDELSQVYVEQATAGERRRLSHRLEWLWNLEAGEMQLRLRNLHVAGAVTPYQIVWVEDDLPAEEAVFADVYETLDPWEVEDEWLIDEVIFAPDGPLNGVLMVLGDDDRLLWQQPVPPLPEVPAQFFRLTQQEVYAIPVAPDKVQYGRYLVALKEGVRFVREEGELEAASTLTLPYLLHNRFETAGFYEIDLPLTIHEDGSELETLTPSGATTSGKPPYIYGEDAIDGLSRRVPPLYRSEEIWLVIPGASERLLTQGTVELRPQQGKAYRRLLKEMDVEVDEAGALWVPLRGLMGRKAGGTYTVELRRGLRSLLQAPLQFSCIPGFEVVPPTDRPASTPVYTPNQPPVVRVRGIRVEQIGNRERLTVTTCADGWIEVTWHDLRGGCRLALSVNNQQVPLEWPVSRFFAWIEPGSEGNILTWETVKEATLHAVGAENVDYFFVGVVDNPRRRQLSLNRHGRTRIPIRQDQLYDMLRHERGAEVKVYVSVFGERWLLFTLRRHPQLHNVRVKHDPARGVLLFENNLKGSWPGDYDFQVQQLSNPSATPRILQSVRQLESRHIIPCELADGIYQFEVWDPGAQQALAKEIFGVGEVERSAFFDEAVRLLESLSRDTAHRLPRWLGGDMIRFLAAETKRTEEGQAELAPEWLWQLALLQPRAYAGAADDELDALWSPLLRFRQIHDMETWEIQHGMLPDWAVMPFQLMMRFVTSGIGITVEPEVVSRQGRRGIGHTYLKMREEQRPVYVRWEPHQGEQVVVYLGLPEEGPDEVDYVQLDDSDMYSVYQCRRCRRFVDSNWAPEVVAQHRHGRAQAILKDVWICEDDDRLLAEVTPKRREDIRDYRLAPSSFADRKQICALLQRAETDTPPQSTELHPLGRAAYLYASSSWVTRYRQDRKAAQALSELVADTKRRQAFTRLADYLSESRWFDVGAWGALGRFLAAFPWERDAPLVNVDRYTLLLALRARTRVHARLRANQLRAQLGLTDAELAEMLQVLNRYCPELVAWAFTWVELFFLHAAG